VRRHKNVKWLGAEGWSEELPEQGLRRDAGVGVQAAGLPESGSGFAVFLVHIRSETSG
jgi:hypothetical protein